MHSTAAGRASLSPRREPWLKGPSPDGRMAGRIMPVSLARSPASWPPARRRSARRWRPPRPW